MTDPLRHHGDAELAPGLLDFAVNVRVEHPPDWLLSRLQRALPRLAAYPDATAALAAVSRRHGCAEDRVLLTSGASEAFVLLARALRPAQAVCVHPSFTEPEAALRSVGHPVHRLVLAPPYALDPADVPETADLVVVGNPTNPTGVVHPHLERLCRPGRVVVVDEAFADTVPGEPHSLAGRTDLPGLVVVRSLTKTWGLAGLRVGYLVAEPGLVRRLREAQPAWPVSSLALVALDACLGRGPVAAAERAAEELAVRRAALQESLRALGLVVEGESGTSFVLVRVPGRVDVWDRLRERGVAVRRGDTFPGLTAEHVRIAVRDPAANEVLLTALARVLAG